MTRSAPLPAEVLQMVQAPMVGTSDLPFRLLCARWGATLTYTQMLHSAQLLNDRDFQEEILRDLQFGRNLGVDNTPKVVAQLAGNNPLEVREAGRVVAGLVDAVELNLGCPQQRAKDGHYGGYLVSSKADLPLVSSIFSSLRTLPVPVHAKIRLPPPSVGSISAYALPLVQSGASVVTLHARPVGAPQRRRATKGLCTPSVGELKRILIAEGWPEIGVVGNGGVRSWEDVGRLTHEEGVEGWMVGEELAGNPRFFSSDQGGTNPMNIMEEYLDLVDLYPGCVPLSNVRRHLKDFVERDYSCSHTRYYKPFLRNLAEATTIHDIRAIAMDETLHDVWGPQYAE